MKHLVVSTTPELKISVAYTTNEKDAETLRALLEKRGNSALVWKEDDIPLLTAQMIHDSQNPKPQSVEA